jgi:hypothetical protein
MYYDPHVGLQLPGGHAGDASYIAMFANGDPAAAGYEQANSMVGAGSLFQCYWDDTGIAGDWWECNGFFTLARAGTMLTADDGCYPKSATPLLWRPFNESTATHTLGKCSP